MIRFTLYSRSYCHLCDDLLDALHALQTDTVRFAVEVIDVDADPALVERFDELVPVLFGDPAGPELCHYFLDEAAVRAYLAALPVLI
ncbi:glutaredoxin family protein [Massilia antarctica]|uniref:glutaredoxin family protein n=1 Tax=Massilia antarctica TaxID=2765360 RepID=UPI0006BB8D0D|nr:glutaredoxin family protein [Massilia sp. H27-R4]MCY0914140.1 glutaredoxin family protein [Massilia sp. H27-R4]CUI08538.1 putative thioredoxin [Janthinobacterium sp. CG23_2]CUU32324.1 putative thioredoxin [Janthinobacterium sp. CG23_2]